MSQGDINLLKRDMGSSRALSDVEQKLKMGAWWGLVALLGSGIIIGSMFFILQSKSAQSVKQNTRLKQQIDAQLVKEGILLSLKERTGVAGKALRADRPWGNLFPILSMLTRQDYIKTLSVDESGKVGLVLSFDSVEDAITIVNNAVSLVDEHRVRSPQLISFAIKEDGSIQMGLSFIPVL